MSILGRRLLALVCGMVITAAGCGNSEPLVGSDAVPEAEVETAEFVDGETAKASSVADASEKLPVYEYPDKTSLLYEVNKYLIENVATDYEPADVSIPVITVTTTDDSNPDDIVVYGDFYIDNYNLNVNILECESGGDYPGAMHLKKTDTGYEVTSFDVCKDGSSFDSSAKEIFGEHYDDFMKVFQTIQGTSREEQRKQIISEYVKTNNLSITAFQDYGWDPVMLD